MNGTIILLCLALLGIAAVAAHAETLVIKVHYVTTAGEGKKIGTVTASETQYGTLLRPNIKGLSPGLHGFHVHENGSCGAGEKEGRIIPGLAAGGHYDPDRTGTHRGPYANGHLGDLPALYVDTSGTAKHPILAPRIKLSDLKGRVLMIHAHGDNYSDSPKLGGGGGRIACGVIGT